MGWKERDDISKTLLRIFSILALVSYVTGVMSKYFIVIPIKNVYIYYLMYLRIKSNNFLINTLSIFGLLALAMRHNFIYVVILSVMLIGLHLIFHYLKNLNLSYVSKENKFLITPSNKKEKLLKTLVFF